MEQHILMSGDSYAARRIAAGFSSRGAVLETFQGVRMLRWIQNMDEHFEQEGEKLSAELGRLCRRMFNRERVIISVTGDIQDSWILKFLRLLPEGNGKEEPGIKYPALPVAKSGIVIPAEIGFAAKGANLGICSAQYCGAMKVAARILSYGYLWDTVRVKNGAYGTRLAVSENGDVAFTSYRDPAAALSLAAFDGAGAALRSFCEGNESPDRYIISTIASENPLLSARQKGMRAAADYLEGVTPEMRQKVRSEILHTSKEELVRISYIFDCICSKAGVCIIGGKASTDMSGELSHIENL